MLALTRGDPSGIGLEVACKAWLARDTEPFILVADLDHCRRAAAGLGLAVPFAPATPQTAGAVFPTAMPVLPLTSRLGNLAGRTVGSRRRSS